MAALKTSPKPVSLSVAQSQALASAAGQDHGVVVLPARLKGAAAQKFVDALIEKGVVREIRAKPDMPVWRREAETGRSYALVITRLGRASISAAYASTAVQVQPKAPGKAQSAASQNTDLVPHAGSVASREDHEGTEATPCLGKSESRGAADAGAGSHEPRSGSKLAGVIAMLSRETGASIEELMASTGWLPHTTRAALTGLRKRGYLVRREQGAGPGSVYRIGAVSCAKAA